MYRAFVTIRGIAPLSQSRMHNIQSLDGESKDELDCRTWLEHCHYTKPGEDVFVPASALKQAVSTYAPRLNIPDPDNKRAKLTKYFVSDVICESDLLIGVKKNQMIQIVIPASSRGNKGAAAGARVPRRLPQIQEWGGSTSFLIMEEKIKPDMFEKVLAGAGMSIGVGQFRPETGGNNGRFKIEKVEYIKV
jgi:hypothetical protein